MKFNKDFWLCTPRFCEYYFWESGKEYLNTLSSLAITFFGLYGLLQYSQIKRQSVLWCVAKCCRLCFNVEQCWVHKYFVEHL